MAKITRENYETAGTLLTISTQARGAIPDGNYFLDTANDVIELIDSSVLATTSAETNGLIATDKVQLLAIYFSLFKAVNADTNLQNFRFPLDAVVNRMGKLVGAMSFLNGFKLATQTDYNMICDTGFTEFAASNGGDKDIDRVYHGVKSTIPINSASQAYYQLAASLSEADREAAIPVNFSQLGDVNEVVQTFGTTAFGDTNAGDFDLKNAVLILNVRDFGFKIDEVTSVKSGITELGAYSQGYALGNPAVTALAAINEADVWGVGQVAPYTGLDFTRLTTPATETGFNEADGQFTDRITNTGSATLIQVRAYLDMLMQSDNDENTNTANTGVFRPKRQEPLYSITATGKLKTRAGLFIEGITSQDIIQTADDGSEKTYPFLVRVTVKLSNAWFNDTDQFFKIMYLDGAGTNDFDTDNAVVVNDTNGTPLVGDKLDSRISPDGTDYKLVFNYDYTSNTQAGLSAGIDKPIAIRIGGASSKSGVFFATITEVADLTFEALTGLESN